MGTEIHKTAFVRASDHITMTSTIGGHAGPKIGTTIDMCGAKDAIRIGTLAEKLGYDSLWFADHFIDTGGMKVDPWSTMGAISQSTNRIVMCSAVTDTQRSHPARTAHTVATLNEI